MEQQYLVLKNLVNYGRVSALCKNASGAGCFRWSSLERYQLPITS
jgi:hypothetical protein